MSSSLVSEWLSYDVSVENYSNPREVVSTNFTDDTKRKYKVSAPHHRFQKPTHHELHVFLANLNNTENSDAPKANTRDLNSEITDSKCNQKQKPGLRTPEVSP